MANNNCLVMVLVKTTPEYHKELVEKSMASVEQMKRLPGFLSHTLLKSDDDTLIVSRIEWETKANHEACFNHACWQDIRKEWANYLDTGKATMDVSVLEVIQQVVANHAAK